MPSGPIKCAGAPQKIAYLAADYWRKQGVLEDIRVVMVLPTPGMFGSRCSPMSSTAWWKNTASKSASTAKSPQSTPTPARR